MDGALKYVSSGNDVVIGVNANDEIFQRLGITAANPTGVNWSMQSGQLKVVDTLNIWKNWGVNSADAIFHS